MVLEGNQVKIILFCTWNKGKKIEILSLMSELRFIFVWTNSDLAIGGGPQENTP